MRFNAQFALCCALFGQTLFGQAVERPHILGVAHMAVYVKDLDKTRQFYEKFLGFGEPFTLPRKDGTGTRIVFVKVNDNQYIEIFNEKDRGEGQLNHISIYTESADRMRDYLATKGVEVPAVVGKGQTRNKNFNIKDPDGHIVEIVEYQPDSWTARESGEFEPPTRIADHIMHVGVLAGDLEKSMAFYRDILGFKEFWRGGGGNGKPLQWVNMKVPDGEDYVELMLYSSLPEPNARGTKNHMSLMVPDAQKAVDELQKRAAKGLYDKEIKIQIGVNKKRQVNLYDPDGTRVELMEANTVDGKPAPSSDAPAPKPSPAKN